MEWDVYREIRQLLDQGYPAAAIELIENSRDSTVGIRSFISCLEASSYEMIGKRENALEILERAPNEQPKNNFWVYHAQAALLRNLGRIDESILATQQAQRSLGWSESEERGYVFLHDFFSANIPSWIKWFDELITFSPIDILEIGSWQGGSSTWLLDKIISKRGGRLTCVDTFEGSSEHAGWINTIGRKIEDIFDYNMSRCVARDRCRKIVGRSQDILRALSPERFNFIYIDGAHEARLVMEDAVLAFGLIDAPGYILFDDYDFKFKDHPSRDTAHAIDAFISLYADEIDVIAKDRQCLIRKRQNPL